MAASSTPPLNTELIANMLQREEVSVDDLMQTLHLPSLSGCLNELMGKKNCSTDILAELAGMNRASLYKVLNGEMRPSRNTLLRLGLALEIRFEEAQVLLKCGNCSALSSIRARDLILIDGFVKHRHIDDVNQLLEDNDFMNLYSRG